MNDTERKKTLNSWQTFSITGTKENQHLIIKLIIKPFIQQYYCENKIIKEYYLELSQTEVGKINVAVLISDGDLNPKVLLPYFSKITTNRYFIQKTKNFKFHIACDDFLFPSFKIPSELMECGFFTKVSAVMIQKLIHSPTTEGQLLNFSLYLHLCWIKEKNIENLTDAHLIILKGYILRNSSEKILTYTTSIYENNIQLYSRLYECIMSTNSKLRRPAWIMNWSKDCFDIIIRNEQKFKDRKYLIELSSYYFPAIINQQLGISGTLNDLQTAFINTILINQPK
jgi:hypothetical protein